MPHWTVTKEKGNLYLYSFLLTQQSSLALKVTASLKTKKLCVMGEHNIIIPETSLLTTSSF